MMPKHDAAASLMPLARIAHEYITDNDVSAAIADHMKTVRDWGKSLCRRCYRTNGRWASWTRARRSRDYDHVHAQVQRVRVPVYRVLHANWCAIGAAAVQRVLRGRAACTHTYYVQRMCLKDPVVAAEEALWNKLLALFQPSSESP